MVFAPSATLMQGLHYSRGCANAFRQRIAFVLFSKIFQPRGAHVPNASRQVQVGFTKVLACESALLKKCCGAIAHRHKKTICRSEFPRVAQHAWRV